MATKYTYPALTGHKVLYNGKRYIAFEVDKDHPFEGFEEWCDMVVADKVMGFVGSTCTKLPDGSYKCSYPYGPHDLDTSGKDAREVAQYTYARWLETWDK